tara:strand:- start:30 stop:494 length:465 start_codon:yes stop_codon:yes gene_type:complete
MQTKNLIQASANVLKITSLSIGDVVKQVDDSYSSSDIYYGVVTDLMNDGEKTFVQITRYKQGYGKIDADVKIYKGGVDLNIFPATIKEVKTHLDEAIKTISEKIEKEERDLADKKQALKNAIDFVSMETTKNLTEASYKEVTQAEYERLKQPSF